MRRVSGEAEREGFPSHSPEVIVYSVLVQGKRVAGPTCRDMGEPALVL
jgi:hypothetical protein